MKTKIDIFWAFILAIVIFTVMQQCTNNDVKIITKTETVIETVVDTITKVIIQKVPGPKIYVEKVKTVKGKDSIVYKDKPSETTITANKYKTELESEGAIAKLEILTTGEILDVKGTITYPKEITTTKITKKIPKSGAFLFLETNLKRIPDRYAIGIDYQIKNKILLGTSVSYNLITNNVNLNVKVGFKIF
tara:strand:+ start:672 stop:1244 length:573 start_codon:yes stop_codon:yes gene_type:complete